MNDPDIHKIGEYLGCPRKVQGLTGNIKDYGYIRPSRKGRFELKNIILYIYEVLRGTRLRKLRFKFVTNSL